MEWHCGGPESGYLKNAVSQFHRPGAVGELTVASSIDQSSRPVFLTIQIRVYSRIPTKTVIRARTIEMMAIPSGANESGLSKLDTTLGGGGIAGTSASCSGVRSLSAEGSMVVLLWWNMQIDLGLDL